MCKIKIDKKDFEDFCNIYHFFDWQKEYLWYLLTNDRQYFVPPFSRYKKYYFNTIHVMSKFLMEVNNEKES